MSVKDLSIDDFDYPLPQERIALHPLRQRDACRLLMRVPGAPVADRRFSDLPALIPSDALLVCNDTRVINARMRFHKPTGAAIEIFLLEPLLPADYERAFAAEGSAQWSALVGNVKKWKEGELVREIALADGTLLRLSATLGEQLDGGERRVTLSWTPATVPFATVVEAAGHIPIPPYLNRESEASDTDDYQTVYSRAEGSVAAPTAGLHFTPELLAEIDRRGIRRAAVTLHVGAGTFKPVKTPRIGDHPMHTETFTVTRASLEALIEAKRAERPVIAVGTTSVRTLETLPLLADMVADDPETPLHLGQWNAYTEEALRPRTSLQTAERLMQLLRLLDTTGAPAFTASTAIMIAPGFNWTIVDGMVTNFHQPRSTLLLLVSSFLSAHSGGTTGATEPEWRRLYSHALQSDYRFLSYGDACLFLS